MEKIFATLDDGRRIAVLAPPGGVEAVERMLVRHASNGSGTASVQPKPIEVIKLDKRLPVRRSDGGIAAVLNVCRACPKFQVDERNWTRCAACNCVLDHKILPANSSCPEGHWGREEPQEPTKE